MKHLKKILIVIAMLALLVASLATVIGAEEGKTVGTVEKINEYISKIEAELSKPADETTPADQAKEVTKAYDYIRDPEITWEGVSDTAEYKAAVAKLDGYCVQIADAYCDTIEDAAKNLDKATADVNAVYTYITKCAPSEETAGYADVIAKLTAKNEAVTEALFKNVVIPAPDSEKHYSELTNAVAATKVVFKQIDKCPLVSDDVYAKYSKTAYDITTLMLDRYEAFLKVATTSSTDYFKTINDIRTVESFVVATDITKADGYSATIDRLNANLEVANKALDEKRKALDALAPFEEYDYGYFLQKYFDGTLTSDEYSALSPADRLVYDESNGHLPYPNTAGEHKTERVFETLGGKDNGYLKFMYGPDSIHHYTYFDLAKASGMEEYGLVFEWDMRINETSAYSVTLQDVDTVRKEGGYSVFANLFNTGAGTDNFVKLVSGGGNGTYLIDPSASSAENRVTVPDAVVIDVWAHYTITYNPETRMGALYVNYEKVFDIYHFNTEKFTCNMRFGPTTVTNWEGWDLDNIVMYYGTAFRITDKFSSMTKDQQFEYFVNYAFDGNGHPEEYLARNNAYNKAKVLADSYSPTNPSVIKFKEIDYNEDIKYPAMNQNLGILTEKVEKLKAIDVTTDNIKKITDAIADINSFVSKNASLIDKADSINKETDENRYQTQMSVVYSTEANVKKLEVIQEFVDAVKKFERATTLSARTRYANIAAEIYAKGEYEIEENRKFVANDPVVDAFELMLNNQLDADGNRIPDMDDEGNPNPNFIGKYILEVDDEGNVVFEDGIPVYNLNPDYITIFKYYDSFASILSAREKLENSKNIINAMNIVADMDGYEATDEYFAANYEELKSYTTLVRGYIGNGNYDTEYPGIDAALEVFYAMDPYFFERLQLEHIEALEEMLAKYNAVNTLVEKVAVVNSVKAYLENEDTALNNTTVAKAVRMRVEDEREALLKLQTQNDVYEMELMGYEDSYLDVLAQQTEYFINIINHMDSVIVFSEIEELFAEASVYYYGINLNVEGALEAAEKYADYRAYIASVKANNDAFSMYVKELKYALDYEGIEKRDEVFKALKNASVYADFVDENDERIAYDLEFYYEELAAYENNITAIENAIYEAVQFTNALRTNTLPATVLSVIGKLINN